MLSPDIVKQVARLCRLKLSDAEVALFTRELSEILSYIEKLNKLDTEAVKPLTHVLPLSNVLREDEVKDSLPVEKSLANAPEKVKNFFSVPKIID
jgi:aspartyl-tRNA(Asn)/glutamyl-tRNA(Gln) amidotransferase subunit C